MGGKKEQAHIRLFLRLLFYMLKHSCFEGSSELAQDEKTRPLDGKPGLNRINQISSNPIRDLLKAYGFMEKLCLTNYPRL